MTAQKCMHIDAMDARKKIENVKNDAICHVTRQNQYNPAGGGATIIYFTGTVILENDTGGLILNFEYLSLEKRCIQKTYSMKSSIQPKINKMATISCILISQLTMYRQMH